MCQIQTVRIVRGNTRAVGGSVGEGGEGGGDVDKDDEAGGEACCGDGEVMLVVKNVVYKGKLKVIYNSYKVALVFVITWTCQPIHLAPEKQHLVLAHPEDTELRL